MAEGRRIAESCRHSMPNTPIQVYIVDDEPSICTAYARLVRSAKMQPHTFTSVEDFIGSDFSDQNACVVSDLHMPGTSGLICPGACSARPGVNLPVIFVTAPRHTRDPRTRAERRRRRLLSQTGGRPGAARRDRLGRQWLARRITLIARIHA